MTVRDKFNELVETISSIYDFREANNIVSIIFEDAFGINLISQDNFPEKHLSKWDEYKRRLLTHEPFQYILEEADFYGLKFKVNPSVLIPRPETEELVYWVEQWASTSKSIQILEIGTGSGCIAITLAKQLSNAKVTAIDVSENALSVAMENAKLNDVDVLFSKLDILDDDRVTQFFDNKNYHLIASNPPYIPKKESTLMRKNVLDFEPSLALFVENHNPLIFYQKITKLGTKILEKNGILIFEINENLGDDIYKMMEDYGYKNIEIIQDIHQKNRMVKGEWL